MTKKLAKLQYAQSSDIRSRTYVQYRHDMKKKGIVELEFLPYLRDILIQRFGDESITVEKYGSDSKLWFFRSGGQLTQTPDYLARQSGQQLGLYEFQYASSAPDYFDFKVSKIGTKRRGASFREPYTDREIFYVILDENKFSVFTPEWVIQNGEEGFISAWRSQGYRVKREEFLPIFQEGGSDLRKVIQSVEDKQYLLEFQKRFLEKENERLAQKLQRVVDEEIIFKIVPRTLTGIYEVCYFMYKLDRKPDVPGMWLVYLATLFKDDLPSIEFAKLMFAFDFVYFKCDDFPENEKQVVKQVVAKATDFIERRINADNGYVSVDPQESLIEGTSHIIFSVNLLEDIVQDAVVNFGVSLPCVNKIFQTLPNVALVANVIRGALESRP